MTERRIMAAPEAGCAYGPMLEMKLEGEMKLAKAHRLSLEEKMISLEKKMDAHTKELTDIGDLIKEMKAEQKPRQDIWKWVVGAIIGAVIVAVLKFLGVS